MTGGFIYGEYSWLSNPEPTTSIPMGRLATQGRLSSRGAPAHRRRLPALQLGYPARARIAVMYGAGLRLAEALALLPKDVDTEAGTVRVLRGKGSKSRLVGIDPRSC
jgi:integrase